MSSFLYNHVLCSSGYEVIHTQGTGSTSDIPAYNHDDYSQDDSKQKEYDLSGFKRISPTPKFTLSHLYISPEEAEPHFTRAHSQSKSNYVDDGYGEFLNKNFQDEDDDVKSNYRNENYDDDDSDGGNSKYRQKDDENNDDDEEDENSKYRQAPKDEEEYEHHSSYTYNNDDEPIRSLPQKDETGTNGSSKNCKVIVKGKAMCKLCKDPVSGAKSESCSFSSTPPEEKYAFIKKEKYIS